MNTLLNIEEYKFRNNDIKNICNWIKKMPNKNNIKNIFSFSNECYELELNIINYFRYCKHFQILKPDLQEYSKCIEKIFGNFKFKISNDNFEDFLPEPNTSYDLIILYHTVNSKNIDSLINKCIKMTHIKSKILIFSFNSDSILSLIKKFNKSIEIFQLKNIKSLLYNKKFKIFSTSINSTMNIKGISKSLIEKIIQNNLDNSKLEEVKNYILKNYLNKIIKQKIDIFLLNY